MKKTHFGRPAFSVAMSKDTGCIVMVSTQGEDVKVMGSLSREASLEFAKSIVDFVPEPIETPKRPTLTLVNGS